MPIPADEADEERQEKLAEDNKTPFRPAEASQGETAEPIERRHEGSVLSTDHPVTDTNIVDEEIYDEGVAGAAEATEPNAGNAVVNYDPGSDERVEPMADNGA